jgi:hypothetical protein
MTDRKKPQHIDIEDHYCRYFTGSEYTFKNINTVGDLISCLDEIVKNIDIDPDLEIEEVYCHNGKLGYILREGFITE